MAGFGRAVLIAMIAVASLMVLFNLAFFFPWYLTMVETGFAVSQHIATDNYLRCEYYDSMMYDLGNYPIFDKRQDKIEIKALHSDGFTNAIATVYGDPEDFYDGSYRPYVQMGNPVLITVSAVYPFQMTLFGAPIQDLIAARGIDPALLDIPVSFSMTTTTTKHYKDLPYAYFVDDADDTLKVYDEFFNDWDII